MRKRQEKKNSWAKKYVWFPEVETKCQKIWKDGTLTSKQGNTNYTTKDILFYNWTDKIEKVWQCHVPEITRHDEYS